MAGQNLKIYQLYGRSKLENLPMMKTENPRQFYSDL